MSQWRARMHDDPGLLRAWVKHRARDDADLKRPVPAATSGVLAQAIHPVRIVDEAEHVWMDKWGRKPSSHGCDAVSNLLSAVPALPMFQEWLPDLSGAALRRVAMSMKGKAAGPDSWRIEDWLLLPDGFWCSLSRLWLQVLACGVVPARWSEGQVVLIPKPSHGMRPLTVLNVAWRIGAKAVAMSLRGWTTSWASCRTLGGVSRRSTRDVYLQVLESLDCDENCYVQQDLSKFFDSVQVPQLLLTLERFGAPSTLRDLVRGFYDSHFRVFSYMGTCGKRWRRITSGIAQGCPLSPVLVATVMATWSICVEGTGNSTPGAVRTVSFVDDRLVWCASADVLRHQRSHAGAALAASFNYEAHDFLDLLGIRITLHAGQVPVVGRFELSRARRLIHFIGVTPAALEEDLVKLNNEATWLLGTRNVADAARVVLCEVAGWDAWPSFAYQKSALAEAIRLASTSLDWIEDAPLTFVCRKWYDLLPVTNEVLRALGWWTNPAGTHLFRRDSVGDLRQFQLGVDNREVILEWLRDVHRRLRLASCSRVCRSLHRDPQPDLAQGLDLPGPPPESLCLFQGHVKAWKRARDSVDRATALAGGCSSWYKVKRDYTSSLPAASQIRCLCGLRQPSRPHLMWACPRTAEFRAGLEDPPTRLEERLPAWWTIYQDYIQDIAAAIDEKLATSSDSVLFVATDGSVVDTVASWSLVFEDEQRFAQGVRAEDQTPHRAELEGLLALLRALDLCRGPGALHVISDCKAALQVADGGGLERIMASFFTALRGRLRDRFDVRFWKTAAEWERSALTALRAVARVWMDA
ncbi:unnamed protein product [Symbiodinium sp. CCMP2592]|nr:unnamed protein product [Symbiodinium sp. CCMP2592]